MKDGPTLFSCETICKYQNTDSGCFCEDISTDFQYLDINCSLVNSHDHSEKQGCHHKRITGKTLTVLQRVLIRNRLLKENPYNRIALLLSRDLSYV